MKSGLFLISIFMVNLMGNVFGDGVCVEEGCLLSHGSEVGFEEVYGRVKERLELGEGSREEALGLLEMLGGFELGRFLLVNGGVDGYWIAYAILYSEGLELENELEEWLVRRSPVIKATRERFGIFKREIEKRVREGVVMASIPCGMMDDFLLAEKGGVKDVRFVGIDLDARGLALATEHVSRGGLKNFEFMRRDAWNLGVEGEYDLIASNGLSMYEADEGRRVALYGSFCKALKVGGVLVTSFFTKSPAMDEKSPWRNYDLEDVKKQRTLFVDVVGVKFQVYCTEEEVRGQLESVGFKVLEVIYDEQAMMPTVVAERVY